jgi:L-rhamnose isomerase
MGNRLFQDARKFVQAAKENDSEESILKAKNALSSAYANSTTAEKQQLQELQKELDTLQ